MAMPSPGLCPSRPAQAPARSHQHSLIVLSHIHQPFVHLPTYPSVHQPVTLWAHPWAGQMLLFMGESRPWRGALQPEASSAGPRRLLPSPAGSSCEPVSLSVPPPQQNLHTMLQSVTISLICLSCWVGIPVHPGSGPRGVSTDLLGTRSPTQT